MISKVYASPNHKPVENVKITGGISVLLKKAFLFFSFFIFTGLITAQAPYQEIQNQYTELKTLTIDYDSLCSFKSQGDIIFYRKWGKSYIPENHKVLLIIHGVGYHSYPFMKIMNYVDQDSILVYAMDLRGHGLSGKTKGDLESNEKILTDIDNMVGIIKKENPNSEIFILGTSMGGLYSLGYLLSNKINSKLSGAILVCPALKVDRSQAIQISNLKLLWLMIFNHSKPEINIDGKKLEMSSINNEWNNSRRNDSLAIHNVSVEYLQTIHKMQKWVKRKSDMSVLSSPVLIQHGGKDKIVDLKGSYFIKENLINAKTELIVYPGSYHSMFWDNDSNQILGDIAHWIIKN